MDQVIENYESLSSLTSQMRDAATRGEWEKLIALEKQCLQRTELMKAADTAAPALSEDSRKRKVNLIHKILADDAAIRSHTEPWMAQLQRIMRNARSEQLIRRTYSGR